MRCVDEHNQEKTNKPPRLNSPDAGCGLLSKGGQVPNPQAAQPAPTDGRTASSSRSPPFQQMTPLPPDGHAAAEPGIAEVEDKFSNKYPQSGSNLHA